MTCSICFSVPSFWMGGGLHSRCVGRVYGADGAVRVARHHPHRRQDNKISNVHITSLWCLRGTIFAVETQQFILCFFPKLFHKRHNLRRKCIEDKTYFVSSISLSKEISHPKKNSERYKKYTKVFMYNTRYFSQISINLDFSGQIFEKSLNIKLYENSSRRSRVIPCGRTNVTKLIFAFHNVTNAPKNLVF